MFGSTLPGGSTGVSLPAAPEYQAADATNMVREPADCQIYLGRAFAICQGAPQLAGATFRGRSACL